MNFEANKNSRKISPYIMNGRRFYTLQAEVSLLYGF